MMGELEFATGRVRTGTYCCTKDDLAQLKVALRPMPRHGAVRQAVGLGRGKREEKIAILPGVQGPGFSIQLPARMFEEFRSRRHEQRDCRWNELESIICKSRGANPRFNR